MGSGRIAVLAVIGAAWAALGTGCGLSQIGAAVKIEGVASGSYAIKLDGRDFDIAYAWAGDESGQRVIFVHGTPGSMGAWARYLRRPIDGVETLAIDRPGFGSTTPSRAVCGFEDQARALEPLLVERNGKWPILVGHSLGGPIVARVAADYPDRVGALVIMAGSLSPKLEHPRWFNYMAGLPIVNPFLSRSLKHANKEIMAAPRETRELGPLLGHVTCPVVIMHGKKDTLVPFENVAYMQKMFTSSEQVTVIAMDRERHFIPWTQEGLVRQVVERLAGVGGQAGK